MTYYLIGVDSVKSSQSSRLYIKSWRDQPNDEMRWSWDTTPIREQAKKFRSKEEADEALTKMVWHKNWWKRVVEVYDD